MTDWANRPLDGVYAAVFIDAIMVKVRDGQVANQPIYAAIGVTLDGEKDVLGLWAGTGGEGAKFWMAVLTDLKNRGVDDVFFLVCDGLKGLPEVVSNVWPLTTVQTCIIHLIRNTFRLASKRDWDRLKLDVKPIYTAPNEAAARAALDDVDRHLGRPVRGHHPAVGRTPGPSSHAGVRVRPRAVERDGWRVNVARRSRPDGQACSPSVQHAGALQRRLGLRQTHSVSRIRLGTLAMWPARGVERQRPSDTGLG